MSVQHFYTNKGFKLHCAFVAAQLSQPMTRETNEAVRDFCFQHTLKWDAAMEAYTQTRQFRRVSGVVIRTFSSYKAIKVRPSLWVG